MTERIGVMGGMFDPVHLGHTAVARAACQALALDCLYLVPCARPNHREGPDVSGEHRLRMLALAVRDDPGMAVDARELRRPGKSYTVDTLRSFAEEFPGARLVFVSGWDSFLTLPRWERWREILECSHLCAVSRPGTRLPRLEQAEDRDHETMARLLQECRVSEPEAMFGSGSGKIYVLDDVHFDVASSEMRELLATGHSSRLLLDPAVAAYIEQHGLYWNHP